MNGGRGCPPPPHHHFLKTGITPHSCSRPDRTMMLLLQHFPGTRQLTGPPGKAPGRMADHNRWNLKKNEIAGLLFSKRIRLIVPKDVSNNEGDIYIHERRNKAFPPGKRGHTHKRNKTALIIVEETPCAITRAVHNPLSCTSPPPLFCPMTEAKTQHGYAFFIQSEPELQDCAFRSRLAQNRLLFRSLRFCTGQTGGLG